jgi:hypothetical protein
MGVEGLLMARFGCDQQKAPIGHFSNTSTHRNVIEQLQNGGSNHVILARGDVLEVLGDATTLGLAISISKHTWIGHGPSKHKLLK